MSEATIFRTISRPTLERKVNQYFAEVKQRKHTPSMTGLALHLGCTRKNIIDYKNTDEFGDILDRAKLMCENALEEKVIAGTPPTGLIFILKNNYGWNDKIEVDNKHSGMISLSALFDNAAQQRVIAGKKEEVIEGEVVETAAEELLFQDEEEDDLFIHEELPQELF